MLKFLFEEFIYFYCQLYYFIHISMNVLNGVILFIKTAIISEHYHAFVL